VTVALPVAATVAGVTLAAQTITKGKKGHVFTPARVIVGSLGLGLFLAAVETGSPEIAKGLGILIITTVILVNGQTIFDFISAKAG
jgi:hypothetical protein